MKLFYRDDFEKTATKKLKITKIDLPRIVVEIGDASPVIKYQQLAVVKDDISYQRIFELWNTQNTNVPHTDKTLVAKYCLQDCNLVLRLIEKLDIVGNALQMARICNIPFEFIFSRGQGIRILALAYRVCNKKGFYIPDRDCADSKQKDEDWQGGYVHTPAIGYYQKPIIVLDFESLYPNCMIDKNLSRETFVPNLKESGLSRDDVHEIKISDTRSHFFAKKQVRRGIFPEILETLLEQRKTTKKLMEQAEQAKDELRASVYNTI